MSDNFLKGYLVGVWIFLCLGVLTFAITIDMVEKRVIKKMKEEAVLNYAGQFVPVDGKIEFRWNDEIEKLEKN